MSLSKDEMLELAKKCGAETVNEIDHGYASFRDDELLAYTSAIEQKYQAQIAWLVGVIGKYRAAIDSMYNHSEITREAAIQFFGLHHPDIATTQATAEAWEREVKARARSELLNELISEFSDDYEEYSAGAIKEWAELRNRTQLTNKE